MRVTVGKPTFRFSRFGRSGGFGGRIRLISTRFTVYFDMRSGPPKSIRSWGAAYGARNAWGAQLDTLANSPASW